MSLKQVKRFFKRTEPMFLCVKIITPDEIEINNNNNNIIYKIIINQLKKQL